MILFHFGAEEQRKCWLFINKNTLSTVNLSCTKHDVNFAAQKVTFIIIC